MLFEETSGKNPDGPYEVGASSRPAWNMAWGISWGVSWGVVGEDTGIIYETTSGPALSGPYEEN
jgi:hypothetical protein